MAGTVKPTGAFSVTPHKVAVCILTQVYAPPSQASVPLTFSSVSHHNSLGLFIFSLIKACDSIVEPRLDELVQQLREIGDLQNDWLIDHLTHRVSSMVSPDDLFNFFSSMRGILNGPNMNVVDDDIVILDPSSTTGLFVRRCLASFGLSSFEGICHLLTNLGTYCKDYFSRCHYKVSHFDDCTQNESAFMGYENMELENLMIEKVNEEIEARKIANKAVSFHNHAPKALVGIIGGVDRKTIILQLAPSTNIHRVVPDLLKRGAILAGKKNRADADIPSYTNVHQIGEPMEEGSSSTTQKCEVRNIDPLGTASLRTSWQVQGYLFQQADAIERLGSLFPSNTFDSILQHLHRLAPELHRVHYMHFLNSLHHDDYPMALENLHHYFDYSAGIEGLDAIPPSSGANSCGRYTVALLCLGITHFHFGHARQALEALTECVRVSQQQSDDICLAYTLSVICNLLSEIGISDMTGIVGSSCSPTANFESLLSAKQQLFVLLRRSMIRAESLKLKRLEASNHLTMAKFELAHVQRPLLSFGPKSSMKLRTCPINVYKELRRSSCLVNEFGDDTSLPATDGFFCSNWIKNLSKPLGSMIFNLESESNSSFQFSALPSLLPRSVLQMVGSSHLVRATAWEIYGSGALSRVSALVFATCFNETSSSSDAALAYTKLIQHLAISKGYEDAFAALKLAEEKFLCVSKSRILLLKLQLLHERALHRGNLKLAQQLCDELGVLASSLNGVDMDLKTEASLRHARTLLAANQFDQAVSVAHSLFCQCYEFNLEVEKATVLLLLAEIHKKSGNAVMGIPYALASLSFCQSFNLDLLRASATLTLAELWLALGSNHANRALALLHSVFPIILGNGGLELCARAFIMESKCSLADSSFSVSENPETVLEPLMQASEALEPLEYHELAAEAYYLMAITYDKLKQESERDEAANSFRKHIIALEYAQHNDNLYNML